MAAPGTEEERSPRETNFLDHLDSQMTVVDAARARADATSGQPERCLAWMGVERQAERYLREARPWATGRRMQRFEAEVRGHIDGLDAVVADARKEIEAVDEATRGAARRRLGLRIAVVGKGGAGKTMISATLCRILARQGRKILAADLDTCPGLAISLGLGLGDETSGVPMAVEEHAGAAYGWRLASGVTPEQAVDQYAVTAPDGVRFLSLGKIDEPEKQAAKQTVVAVRQILNGFGEPDWDVLGDMEAGPTTPFERYHSFADRVVVVVGPAWRSGLTARRLLPIVNDVPTIIVANRFRDEPDHEGLEPIMRIPYDPDVAAAERLGVAPIDYCPDAPAVKAVQKLAELFLPQEVSL
jgi:CO dehydrogenase maturation factor